MIRAFIAVPLPEALRREVSAIQTNLRTAASDIRWVDPANLHLTLKFLGSIEEEPLARLKEALQAAVRPISPFIFQLEGVGTFPRTSQPRVVWLGVSQGKEKLVEVAGVVEKTCVELGLPAQDRSFSPHLTLGRIQSKRKLEQLLERIKSVQLRRPPLAHARTLILFQSTLTPEGPIYNPLGEIQLGK